MDYDENRNEILEWIDCNIYGLNYSLEKVKLLSLISEVFERMPPEDRKILMFQREVRFIAPITNNSVTEQIFIDPIAVGNEQTTLCRCTKCNEPHFTPKNGRYDILNRSKEEALYTIANELAHVYLEYPNSESRIEFIKMEREVDKQVIKWNFESELRQTQLKYMYGEKRIQNESSIIATDP